jgi:hypothetical protein
LVVSQTITSPFVEELARTVPEGLKASELTRPVGPFKVFVLVQLFVSHSFTSPSEPLARKLPEGLKATDSTHFVFPDKV